MLFYIDVNFRNVIFLNIVENDIMRNDKGDLKAICNL